MIKRIILVVLLCSLIVPASCREEDELRDQVNAFLTNTERTPRRFEYLADESTLQKRFKVLGQVEDSFRYQATLDVDGKPSMEQVIDDDAMAVRVLDPQAAAATFASGAVPASQVITDTLLGGKWVVDPSGAPAKAERQVLGTGDALSDGANVIAYGRIAIDESQEVQLWNEEALEPAYLPSEDHFPKPNEEVAERRYDLVRPAIPRPRRGTTTSGVEELPKTSMFRKMAIYVRGTRVVRIMEEIDIEGHPDFIDAKKKNKEQMLNLLKTIAGQRGAEQIRPRKMSVRFFDFGEAISVRQPADALPAPLRGLFGPARAGSEAEDAQQGQVPSPAEPAAPGGEPAAPPPAEPAPPTG